MGKNKRKNVPGLQDLLDRPICYYCDKDFEDTNYLIDHQKAKHFRCLKCNRRLNTAGGLGVHMSQVHKEKLERVENALEDREDPSIEIFGMIGYPERMLDAHKQRVTNEYFRREAEHRARTGNPPAGTQTGAENKKKAESVEDMKKRLAEFKAKKAAEKAAAANGSGSEANTPGAKTEPADTDTHIKTEPESSSPIPVQRQPNLDLGNGGVGMMRGYDVPPYPPSAAITNQQPAIAPFPMYATSSMPVHSMYPTSAAPNRLSGMPMPSNLPPTNTNWSFGPPKPAQQYPGNSGSPSGIGVSGSPPPPPPPASVSRQNSLPSAPGLPQRPAFDSPNISKEDMAKMHISHAAPPAGPTQPHYYNAGQVPPSPYGAPGPQYGVANPPYGAAYPSNGPSPPQWGMSPPQNGWYPPHQAASSSQPPASYIGDQVDQLIQSVTGEMPNPRPPGSPRAQAYRRRYPEARFRSDFNEEGWRISPEPVPRKPFSPRPDDPSGSPSPPPEHPKTPETPPTRRPASKLTSEEKVIESMLENTNPNTVSTNDLLNQESQSADLATAHQMKTLATTQTSTWQSGNTASSGEMRSLDPISRNPESSASELPNVPNASKLTKAPTTPNVSAPFTSSSKASRTKESTYSKLQWSNNLLSPEEKRAQRYYKLATGLDKRTETVIDQPGEEGQEVTGPVEDSFET